MGDRGEQPTDLLEGVELGGPVCMREGLTVYNGTIKDGEDVLVFVLDPGPPIAAREAFSNLTNDGGLEIVDANDEVVIGKLGAAGTVTHVPALSWPLNKRVAVFRSIVERVTEWHKAGRFMGSIDPDFIMLGESLEPFVPGPGFAPESPNYDSPELKRGMRPDARSDVYGLGRLLHFIVLQEAPPELGLTDPPVLESLMQYPAGLSRIIRRAVRFHREDRYANAGELLDDVLKYGRYKEVGVAHPEAEEKNLGGMSMRPEGPRQKARGNASNDENDPNIVDKVAEAAAQIQEAKPFRLRQSARALLLLLGLVGLVGAFAINYMAGDREWIRLSLCATAGLVGFALFNPGIEREQMLRTLFAAFLAGAMFAWDPSPFVAYLAQRAGLSSPSREKRVDSLKAQADQGATRFEKVDLAGGDLKYRMFMVSNLQGSSLEGADLSHATFFGAKLQGARFGNAKLYGTKFDQTSVAGVIDFDLANCDAMTQLPDTWGCVDGHPKKGAKSNMGPAELGKVSLTMEPPKGSAPKLKLQEGPEGATDSPRGVRGTSQPPR